LDMRKHEREKMIYPSLSDEKGRQRAEKNGR
jgi:hypothetical protein